MAIVEKKESEVYFKNKINTYANHYIERRPFLPVEKYFENLQEKGENLQRSEKYAYAITKNLQKFAFKNIIIWDKEEYITICIGNDGIKSNCLKIGLFKNYEWTEDVRFWAIEVAHRVRRRGLGTALVDAVLKEIPKGAYIRVHHDYSNGFWKSIEKKYNDYTWNLW